MTTLDQSFIKAYSQEEPVGLATALAPAPSPLSPVAAVSAPAVRIETSAALRPPHARFIARVPAALNDALAESRHVDRAAVYAAWTTSFSTLDTTRVGEDVFRPRLEVDQFAWPRVVEQLDEKHASDFTSAIDELVAAAVGQKIVAVVGQRRQAGATTVVLLAARRIARRGLQIAVVDANFPRPGLAMRLGLAVQKGWEDVLAGRADLADVLVYSLADRLTLLPLSGSSLYEAPPVDEVHPAASLATLRHHFDLVLIDAGTVDEHSLTPTARAARAAAGATIVVRDVRHLAGESLRHADTIGTIGVIENFAKAG